MAEFTPLEAPAKDARSLPAVVPPKLIGRDVTLGRIYTQLRDLKATLVYGPAGVGKTALAATLASAYSELAGGVLYLNLQNDTLSELVARVGRAYDHDEIMHAEVPANAAPAVAALLEREKPLLVLDGVHHPQATADFVNRCVRGVPVLLVNETEISGPWAGQRLNRLEPQPAALLFRSLADQPDADEAAVNRLTEAFGYHPFALTVAAGWARASKQSPEAFQALIPAGAGAEVSPSLLALTAAFRSLATGNNNALQGLLLVMGATFTGSASAEMVSLVAGAPVETINGALGLLVQRHLLERIHRGGAYYRLHETTATFLQTWLKGTKGLDALQIKVRDAVRTYTRTYTDRMRADAADVEAATRLAVEMDLILATAQWSAARGDSDVANELAAMLTSAGSFVSDYGYAYDVGLLRRLAATSTTAFPAHSVPLQPPAPRPVVEDTADDEDDLLDEDESLADDLVDDDDLIDLADEDEDADEAVDDEAAPLPFDNPSRQTPVVPVQQRPIVDRRNQADELAALAAQQVRQGKDTEAIASYSEALALFEGLNDAPGMLTALQGLASLTVATENSQAAVLHATRGITLATEHGNDTARMHLLMTLGEAREQLGESGEAIRALEQALEIAESLEDKSAEGQILLQLGYAQLDAGANSSATETWDRALALFRSRDQRALEGRALGGLGTANGELGRWSEAIGYFGSALHIAREVKDRDEELLQLINLADAHVQSNQLGQAVLRYRQALHIAFEMDNEEAIVSTTVDLARLLVESPRHLRIAEMLVDAALEVDGHDRDLRRLKERIEDEFEALGDSVDMKPISGTARDYAANAYQLE